MLNKPQLLRRLLALCGLLLLCSGVALSQLFQLQLLNGEKYVRRSAEFLTTTSTVSAARGEILDRYGRPLVTNNTGFSLVLIYSSFWDGNDKRFDTLLDLTHRIQTAAVDATAKRMPQRRLLPPIPRMTPLRMPQTARIRPRTPRPTPRRRFLRTRRRFRPSTTGCRSRSPRRSPTTAHR